jgi:hypothetical protein
LSKSAVNERTVAPIKARIQALSATLMQQHGKLVQYERARDAAKTGFFWQFDAATSQRVAQHQAQLRHAQRAMQDTVDQINLEVRKLKPAHTLCSRMFVSELLVELLSLVSSSLLSVFSPFTSVYSFLFVLMLGVHASLFLSVTLWLGFLIFPVCFAAYLLVFLSRVPGIAFQYAPTKLEFGVFYCALVLLALLTTRLFLRWSYGSSNGSISNTTVNATAAAVAAEAKKDR